MIMTERFSVALVYANEVHRGQVRKGTEIPYISHLLAVASIALEHGADEDTAIAALLHDAPEDEKGLEEGGIGGEARLKDIRARFGDAVADIVDGCSDTVVQPKPPWKERKENYIKAISEHSRDVQLVSSSDKLHNARAILKDYREIGEELWSRFKGGKEGTLWYYRQLTNHFLENGHRKLAEELDRTVSELERLAGGQSYMADRE